MQRQHKKQLRFMAQITAAVLVGTATCAFGQSAGSVFEKNPEVEEGLRYVEGLQKRNFLQVADAVLKELIEKYPEAKAGAAQLELRGDLRLGRFAEVIKRIQAAEQKGAGEDTLWAMKLALADTFYAYGKFGECMKYYDDFFKAYQGKDGKDVKSLPKSIENLYVDAAYRYTQILELMQQQEKAYVVYKMLIATGKLPQHIARQCMTSAASLAVTFAESLPKADEKRKNYLDEANKICDKLLWVQDLWFGRAIVVKAHILMLQGDIDGAQTLVDRYMSTLSLIHQALVEQEKSSGDPLTRESPMAECRYLLAVMKQERAEAIMADDFNIKDAKQKESVLALLLGARDVNGKRKGDGAYNHFVNVYLKYPESNWAADAGERSEQVRSILVDTFGGKVESKVTAAQTTRVREIQYRDARTLYAQGKFDQAQDRLLKVLNSFPDCEESIPALGDLAKCYMRNINTDSTAILYTETVIGHLAERYCMRPSMIGPAGDELIRTAERWAEYGREDLRLNTYAKFFRLYPTHPSCVTYLSSFGEKAFQEKDYEHALEFYTIVANNYTNSPRAFDALSRVASIYEDTKEYGKAIVVLDDLIKRYGAQPKKVHGYYTSRFRRVSAIRVQALSVMRESTNEVQKAAATRGLSLAIKEFDSLAAELADPPSSAQVDEREKKNNTQMREISLFNKAISLTQLPLGDAERTQKMREMAVKTYEELVAAYPKGDAAPVALIQIGSIYAMMKNAEKAEEALSRLRKEYPESKEAKSALPLIADNLMSLGMKEEAVARYREMFTVSGAEYSNSDLLRATTVLVNAKEFDLAKLGIEKILLRAETNSYTKAQAEFEECRIFAGIKDYENAVAKLKAFSESYKNLTLVVDAQLLLSQIASEAGLQEKDADKRFDLFNVSIDAMKMVKNHYTNEVEKAQCDIETGRIMVRKAKAEDQFGDKSKVADYRGKAIMSYQGFIDSIHPSNFRFNSYVETAMLEVVPLLIEHQLWDIAIETCDSYKTRFPVGKHAGQMNAWRQQALIELGSDAPGAPVAAPATPASASAEVTPTPEAKP